MSQPWWGKEINPGNVDAATRKLVTGEFGKRPKILPDVSSAITAQLRKRRPAFTPEWADPPDIDAGGALVELFGTQLASVARRLNRLPDKSLVEFLDIAGIRTVAARPASAMVQFTLSPAAREPVSVAKGFQIGAAPATGDGDLVVFETRSSHFITPAEIARLIVNQGATQREVTGENEDTEARFAALGDKPVVGDALMIGLAGFPGASLQKSVSFGIRIAAAPGSPPPVSAGGVAPIPLPAAPVLRWEALGQSGFDEVEVTRDETSNLWRSGIVTIKLPPGFAARKLANDDKEKLYWLRLRLVLGGFAKPPQLSFIRLNMVRVDAVRTFRDEVIEPIGDPNSNRMQLKNRPVVPGTLVVEVQESLLSGSGESGQPRVSQWQEVDELFSFGSTDKVFAVDPVTGVVTFGDGKNGAVVPPGFRNVRAAEYKVGRGAASAVSEEEISNLLNSAPFVTGVSNPLPASGGVDREQQLEAIRRGPETIRSGRRSVTVADYAILARFAPGADVRKAHAISGYHPQFPGESLPGVVGVLVVPDITEEGPPIPDEQALRAVSRYLSRNVAPAGVEVVAGAPSYRFVRAEVGFVAGRGGDPGEITRSLSLELGQYLDPLTGGNEGEGWPFGGTLFFPELLQRLLGRIKDVRAIPRLRLILDGVPQSSCADVELKSTELFWPVNHQIFPLESEAN